MNIFAQILGFGATAALFAGYQRKTRRGLLVAKLSADAFWVAHYLCLGGYAGLIPNAVGVVREIVYINRKRLGKANCAAIPLLFVAINWGLGAWSFRSAFDVLPIAASSIVTVALWTDNPRLTKLACVPVSLAFATYDALIGSYAGIINEAISICSIAIYFIKERKIKMEKRVFGDDFVTDRALIEAAGAPIADCAAIIEAGKDERAIERGEAFAREIEEKFVADLEKPGDKMAHVSTFVTVGGTLYATYYANTKEPSEDPKNQTARLVYAPLDDLSKITFVDLQTTGDVVGGKVIDMVYDTVLMRRDEDTLMVLWTARTEENYYRFYRTFSVSSKTLGEVGVNRFKVGDVVNDFSTSGIKSALAANGIPCKRTYSDIGVMQKTSSRVENGVTYFYSGAYSGDFTCVIKSADMITWEYVAQPDFINDSKWENATYVLGDKVYYFVRQQDGNPYGFLTAYDLKTQKWATPVQIEDCQSRGDFILYRGGLYLFHAPVDREHIGVVKIDLNDLSKSEIVLQAKMRSSCFYPFVQYFDGDELAMSYTVDRKHIRLARFTLSDYLK